MPVRIKTEEFNKVFVSFTPAEKETGIAVSCQTYAIRNGGNYKRRSDKKVFHISAADDCELENPTIIVNGVYFPRISDAADHFMIQPRKIYDCIRNQKRFVPKEELEINEYKI